MGQSIVDQIKSLQGKKNNQTIKKTCEGLKDIFDKVIKMAKDYDNCFTKFVTLNGDLKSIMECLQTCNLLRQLSEKIKNDPDLKVMTGNQEDMTNNLDYIEKKLPRLAVDGIVCYTDIVQELTVIKSSIENILKNAKMRNV